MREICFWLSGSVLAKGTSIADLMLASRRLEGWNKKGLRRGCIVMIQAPWSWALPINVLSRVRSLKLDSAEKEFVDQVLVQEATISPSASNPKWTALT